MTNSEQNGRLQPARSPGRSASASAPTPCCSSSRRTSRSSTNLIKWVTTLHQEEHPETGRLIVPGIPLLVIDDEADNASVNTRDATARRGRAPRRRDRPDGHQRPDPPAAAQLRAERLRRLHGHAVREHLHRRAGRAGTLRRGSVPAQLHHPPAGADQLHRPRPGLRRARGRRPPGWRSDRPADRPRRRRQRRVDQAAPQAHRPGRGRIPDSLHEAIRAFVLSCAARRARGQPTAQQHARPRHALRRRPGGRRAADLRGGRPAARPAALRRRGRADVTDRRAARALGARLRDRRPATFADADAAAAALRGRSSRTSRPPRDGSRRMRINGSVTRRARLLRPPRRPDGHRRRRRQALARPDARGPVGQLLPARVEDVRHAHADGPLVRLPPGLRRPLPALHDARAHRLVPRHHRRQRGAAGALRRDGRDRRDPARLRTARAPPPRRSADHRAGEDAQRQGACSSRSRTRPSRRSPSTATSRSSRANLELTGAFLDRQVEPDTSGESRRRAIRRDGCPRGRTSPPSSTAFDTHRGRARPAGRLLAELHPLTDPPTACSTTGRSRCAAPARDQNGAMPMVGELTVNRTLRNLKVDTATDEDRTCCPPTTRTSSAGSSAPPTRRWTSVATRPHWRGAIARDLEPRGDDRSTGRPAGPRDPPRAPAAARPAAAVRARPRRARTREHRPTPPPGSTASRPSSASRSASRGIRTPRGSSTRSRTSTGSRSSSSNEPRRALGGDGALAAPRPARAA